MVEHKKCLILMATYNGEKYLREQLESIVSQTFTNWELLIQDDGSIDSTLQILTEYAQKDSRISYCINREVHGAFPNFHSLIKKAKEMPPYDYYMFSDQDDIWNEDKISILMEGLENSQSQNIPALIFADMMLIDGAGNVTNESVDSLMGKCFVNEPSLFLCHIVYGSNSMFNDSLLKELPSINLEDEEGKQLSHDNLCAKYAAVYGHVIYSKLKTMKYRRHNDNVTSGQVYSFHLKRIINRILNINQLAYDHAGTYNQTLYTINLMREQGIPNDKTELINDIEKLIRKGGFTSIHLLLKYKISFGKPVKTISRSLILFLGLYKKYICQ